MEYMIVAVLLVLVCGCACYYKYKRGSQSDQAVEYVEQETVMSNKI